MSFRTLSTALWFTSVLFVAYSFYVAVVALTGDASGLPLIGSMLSRPQLIDKMSPILIILLFAFVLFEIFLKQREVQSQYKAIAAFQTIMDKADRNQYQPKAFDLTRPRAIRRADLIIECSARELSSLHEAVPAAAALDAGILAVSYGPLNVYAWILPVLGFIGTASGMASAIFGFKEVLGDKGVQVEVVASKLTQFVIPGLAAAFETTILALSAAMVAYLCTNALRNWDQEALDQLDRLCIVLLSRIPQPPTPDGQKILTVLQQISDQLLGVLQVPLAMEDAARAISTTAETLSDVSGRFASAVDAIGRAAGALESASNESLSAANAMRKAVDEMDHSGNAPARPRDGKDTMGDELVSAIRDLQRVVSEPIIIKIERGTPS
jgi:biopolymer transport protein ExbB/TolQ